MIFPALTAYQISCVVNDINRQGFGVVENHIAMDAIADLRALAENEVKRAGGEYVALTGLEALVFTPLRVMARSPEFIDACGAICEMGTGEPGPATPSHIVYRCLSGETGQRHAYLFHYDSYVLTVLIPVIIPDGEQRGDLLMFPNTRPFRRCYLVNLIDKVTLDNWISQALLKAAVTRGLVACTRVPLVVGNVYFFWGCRTIHCNEPCEPAKIRATALFHFVNPHSGSLLRRALRRID